MSQPPLKFGVKLHLARRKEGLTVAEAASKCEVSASSWERWESGSNEPKAGVFLRILRGLKIDLGYFDPADFDERDL